jgi:hypothetical protein
VYEVELLQGQPNAPKIQLPVPNAFNPTITTRGGEARMQGLILVKRYLRDLLAVNIATTSLDFETLRIGMKWA